MTEHLKIEPLGFYVNPVKTIDDMTAALDGHPMNGSAAATKKLAEIWAATAVQNSMIRQASERLLGDVRAAFDTERTILGPKPENDPEAFEAWSESHDEALSELFAGGYAQLLGNGWHGEHTVGPDISDIKAADALAAKIAKDAATRLVVNYSPLDANEHPDYTNLFLLIGITPEKLNEVTETFMQPEPNTETPAPTPQTVDPSQTGVLLGRYTSAYKTADEANVAAWLDMAINPDDALSLNARETMRLSPAEAVYLRGAVSKYGLDAVVGSAFGKPLPSDQSAAPTPPAPPAPVPAAPEPAGGGFDLAALGFGSAGNAPAPAVKTPAAASSPTSASNFGSALSLIKTYSSISDKDLGEILDVSRTQIGKIVNGKADHVLNPSQHAEMLKRATDARDALAKAVDLIAASSPG